MPPCKVPTCIVKRAVFGDPATGVAEYCAEHAPAGYEDVKSKRCEHEDCDAPAGYEDVKSKRCEHEDCDKRPVYGQPGTDQAEFCFTHAPAWYVAV